MRASRKRTIRAIAVVYACALGAASLLPSGSHVLGRWDAAISTTTQNLLHVPAYAGLVVLVAIATGLSRTVRPWRLLAIAGVCLGYGLLLEVAQAAIPGRVGSATDALLNAVGVAAGVALVAVWRLLRRRAKIAQPTTGTQHAAGGVAK